MINNFTRQLSHIARARDIKIQAWGAEQWRIQDLKEGGARSIAREARAQNF